jgi:hypothetical protein
MNVNPNNPPPPGTGGFTVTWLVAMVEYLKRRINALSGGGGGTTTLAIGEPVIDGDANSVLFIDSAGELAQSAGITFFPPTGPPGKLVLADAELELYNAESVLDTYYKYDGVTFINGSTGDTLTVKTPTVVGNNDIVYPNATGTVALTNNLAAYLPLAGGTMTGVINAGSQKIQALATPAEDTDAANKAYVDTFVTGLSPKTAVRVATTGAIAGTYNNILGTFVTTATGVLAIDGVNLVLGDRVLIKNQVAGLQNGIYEVTIEGILGVTTTFTRSLDNDTADEMVSAYTYTGTEGSTQASKGFVQTAPAPITLGTTAIEWVLFNSSIYGAGTGITIEEGNLIASDLSNGVPGLGNIGQSVIGGTTANGALTIVGSTSLSLRTTTAPAIVMNSVSGLGATTAINQVFEQITAIINQSSAAGAGYTTLKVSTVETSVDTGTKKLFELLAGASGTTSKFAVANTGTMTVAAGANRFANDVQTIDDDDYTLLVTDNETWILAPFTVARDIIVPPDVFPLGAQINVAQWGAGAVSFVEGSGVEIRSKGGLLTISEIYVWVTLKQVAANEWSLIGDLI